MIYDLVVAADDTRGVTGDGRPLESHGDVNDSSLMELLCWACETPLTAETVCYLNDNPKSDDPMCSKCCAEAHDSHEYERLDPAGVR